MTCTYCGLILKKNNFLNNKPSQESLSSDHSCPANCRAHQSSPNRPFKKEPKINKIKPKDDHESIQYVLRLF